MERKVPFTTGEYYHIFNRGINKYKIFFKPRDWDNFQKQLYIRNSEGRIDSSRVGGLPLHKIDRGESLVDIFAYTLMPNHFHLLLHEKQEGGISKFMSKLSTSHSMFMNTKYDRSGSLLCRPFKSIHVDSDDYFRWLISYIHLNPLEHEGKIESKYSSFIDYFGDDRPETLIINKEALPIDISDLDSIETLKEIVAEDDYPRL